ncbi:hypothetical protein KR215_011112 [Drosophila sulfurigaster]|nr:hypothetical protein KR215_011112 [Drosophila sulfurigaster]
MNFIGLSLFVVLAMQSWQFGHSDCCTKTNVMFEIKKGDTCQNYHKSIPIFYTNYCVNRLCGDLSTNSQCCGVGTCDVFCCNCIYGCKKGDVGKELKKLYGNNITIHLPKPKPKESLQKVVMYGQNLTVLEPVDPKEQPVEIVVYSHNFTKIESDPQNDS